MPSLTEGKIQFDFPEGWEVTKYDDWPFYKNQFKNCCCGNKAVDFLARQPHDDSLWLIEVKDYRYHRRTKSIHLWDEMALKARDTLAGLVSAKANAPDSTKQWATESLKKAKLRFVLHLEQPSKHSKLFPRVFDPARIQQKVKQLIKPLSPHPKITSLETMDRVPWTAQSIS